MLIGITGKMGSGKDTFYERLKLEGVLPDNLRGMLVERVSFADKLYESAAAALGVSVEFLREKKNDPYTLIAIGTVYEDLGFIPNRESELMSIRTYLQRYGTESHREIFGVDFWVNTAFPLHFSHENKIVCVTDVRFPDERDRVHELDGYVVQIVGTNADTGNHISEQSIGGYDFVIYNDVRDDGFQNLDKEMRSLFGKLGGKL